MSEESKMKGQRLQDILNPILESCNSKKVFDNLYEDLLMHSNGNLFKGGSKVSNKASY